MTFRNVRLDPKISFGAAGGPGFATSIAATESGQESRDPTRAKELCTWDISFAARQKPLYRLLQAFFRAVAQGRAYTWRFKDWSDFEVAADQGVFTALSATTFQMWKRYTFEGFTYDRKIVLPVDGTVTVAGTGSYSVNYTTGIVTIEDSPPGDAPTGWSGEFDCHARFDTDQMRVAIMDKSPKNGELIITWQAIPVVEVIETPVEAVTVPETEDTFYNDTFAGTEALADHTSDSGHTYVDAAGHIGSNFARLQVGNGTLHTDTAGDSGKAGFLVDVVPTSQDYRVDAIVHQDDDWLGRLQIGARWPLDRSTDGFHVNISGNVTEFNCELRKYDVSTGDPEVGFDDDIVSFTIDALNDFTVTLIVKDAGVGSVSGNTLTEITVLIDSVVKIHGICGAEGEPGGFSGVPMGYMRSTSPHDEITGDEFNMPEMSASYV